MCAHLKPPDHQQSRDAVLADGVHDLLHEGTGKSSGRRPTHYPQPRCLNISAFLLCVVVKGGDWIPTLYVMAMGVSYRLVPSREPPWPVHPATWFHVISLTCGGHTDKTIHLSSGCNGSCLYFAHPGQQTILVC